MRVCLLTIGSHGDIRPYVALGRALAEAGHRVSIGTHSEFEPLIRRYSLGFHPVKGNPREVLQSAGGQQVLQSGGNLLKYLAAFRTAAIDAMRGGFDDCLAAAGDAEVLICSYFVMAIGAQIGEKLGIPVVQAHLQPFAPSRCAPHFVWSGGDLGPWLNRFSHAAAEQLFWQTFRDVVGEWRRRSLKLPPLPLTGPFGRLHGPRYPVLNGFSPHLVPRPADWPAWVHDTGFWFLDEPDWQMPAALQGFLANGEPPVYVGFGSMNSTDAAELTQMVIGALQDAGQRGVLMTGWGGLGGAEVPDSVLLLEQAPHDRLFPLMAAAVHHGGAGTTAASLRAGLPTLCVPHFGDQPFWAHSVMRCAAGPEPIPRARLSRRGLALGIAQLTSQRLRRGAARLGEQIRAEAGLSRAVHAFEQSLAIRR